MTSNKNWNQKFEAINNLRILNKYHQKEINQLVQKFWKYIYESLSSVKTAIMKNILMFLNEVFMNASTIKLHDDLIKGVIPIMMKKSFDNKAMVKKEA